MFNLRRDPYEKVAKESGLYVNWLAHKMWTFGPATVMIQQYLATFKEFSARHESATSNSDGFRPHCGGGNSCRRFRVDFEFRDEQPGHESKRTGLLRLLGLDRERLAEQPVGRSRAGDYDLGDSENSRSQSLEGGQLGEKGVRSWHQTVYHPWFAVTGTSFPIRWASGLLSLLPRALNPPGP